MKIELYNIFQIIKHTRILEKSKSYQELRNINHYEETPLLFNGYSQSQWMALAQLFLEDYIKEKMREMYNDNKKIQDCFSYCGTKERLVSENIQWVIDSNLNFPIVHEIKNHLLEKL